MTEIERERALERTYSRLLVAYPVDYRRLRGAEILGVLVDGARPGQRYPRVREVVDILAAGLRQRVGVHTTPGIADGLRIALPIAIALATGMSFGVRVAGLAPVPLIQPYAYLWAAAMAAWVVAPAAGRVGAVLAALATIRLAAAWSYGFVDVFAVCLMGTIAAVAAIVAPGTLSTVDGRDYGSVLWRLPGRVGTALAAAAVGGTGFVAIVWWQSRYATAAQVAVVVLALAGTVLAVRRHGTGLLWAAGLLAPVAVVNTAADSSYTAMWYEPSRGQELPYQLLRHTMPEIVGLLIPMVVVTMAMTIFVVAAAGRAASQFAATTLSRSTLAGLALTIGGLEVMAQEPSIAVIAGCAVLAGTVVAGTRLPRTIVLALQVTANAAILTDASSPGRYERPWPLYVLALLTLLVATQSWLDDRRPRLLSTVVGTLMMSAVAVAVVYKDSRWFTMDVFRSAVNNVEHRPLFLALPAFAAGLVSALVLIGRRTMPAAASVTVALGGLLWLMTPIRYGMLIVGLGVAAATVAVVVAQLAQRLVRAGGAHDQG
jgi:hypothetical protein